MRTATESTDKGSGPANQGPDESSTRGPWTRYVFNALEHPHEIRLIKLTKVGMTHSRLELRQGPDQWLTELTERRKHYPAESERDRLIWLRRNRCPEHMAHQYGFKQSCVNFDSAQESRELNISIEHRNLDDLPLFAAVSYRWGETTDSTTISIDEISLQVRNNVVHMLNNLAKDNASRYLWVDALCID